MKCTICIHLEKDNGGASYCHAKAKLWDKDCEKFVQRSETLGDRDSRDMRCNMAVEIYNAIQGTLNLIQSCEQSQQIYEYFNGDGKSTPDYYNKNEPT